MNKPKQIKGVKINELELRNNNHFSSKVKIFFHLHSLKKKVVVINLKKKEEENSWSTSFFFF